MVRLLVSLRTGCELLLLNDPTSAIDVISQRSRARAIVRGAGENGAKLDFTLNDEDLVVGDQLISSGLDGVFPKGMLVGRIEEIFENKDGFLMKARVKLAVDFSRLEQVFLITDTTKLPSNAKTNPKQAK